MVVVLVGFMGAGKTTVGRQLAHRLGVPFVDSDVLIERRLGRTIRDVFATDGEAAFREIEHRTVAELAAGDDAVVSLGGGAVTDERTRAVLRRACVVYLHVTLEEALARVRSDELRPMLRRPDLAEVYAARLPVYEELATIVVETGGRRPEAVVADVLARLEGVDGLAPARTGPQG